MAEVAIAVEAVQADVAAVGTVIDAAADAALAGRRVLVSAREPCGECEVCRRGGASACPIAHHHALAPGTREVRASTRWLVELGDGLDLPGPTAAAAAGDVALAYTLYARAGIGPADAVVVVGTSAVARFAIEILRGKGIAPVVAIAGDAPAGWREHLAAVGVATADADRAAITAALAAHGAPRGTRPWRLVAVGPGALATALALAGPRAQVTAWVTATDAPLDPGAIAAALAREVTIAGVTAAHPDLVLEAAAMVARGEVDLAGGVVIARPGATWPTHPFRTIVHVSAHVST
jgi:threonine dehydrogenase-like Zn-dependent dehydrogenase